jgi:hypothetical protein
VIYITAYSFMNTHNQTNMVQSDTTQEEVTTINGSSPQQVIRKTTGQAGPQVKGAVPQKVSETKKTIFRFNQVM